MRAITRTYWPPLSGRLQEPSVSRCRPGPTDFQPGYLPSGLLRHLLSLALPALIILCIGETAIISTGEAASASVVFGPQTFERATGGPQAEDLIFSACDPTGTFGLVVENGDPNGTHRASSATIWINGAEVLSPDRLNQRVGRVDVPIKVRGGENHIKVKLASQPGARITVRVEAATPCLRVRIQEPAADARIAERDVLVRGQVEPPEGEIGATVNTLVAPPGRRQRAKGHRGEIGATVNTLVAPVVEGHFAVLVPLVPGENRIQARVVDARGNQAEEPAGEPLLDLEVYPPEGFAPLTVQLRAVTRVASQQGGLDVDFDGDGVADQSGPGVDGATHTYSQEGVYIVRVVQTNSDGSQATGRLVVNVIPRPDLEDKWQQMRGSLGAGDIELALTLFLARSREQYRKQFTALANAVALVEVANDLGNLRCNRFLPGAAECDLRVMRDGKEYSFPVIFERDTDGLWRIRSI